MNGLFACMRELHRTMYGTFEVGEACAANNPDEIAFFAGGAWGTRKGFPSGGAGAEPPAMRSITHGRAGMTSDAGWGAGAGCPLGPAPQKRASTP
jgi:hypothetical protein